MHEPDEERNGPPGREEGDQGGLDREAEAPAVATATGGGTSSVVPIAGCGEFVEHLKTLCFMLTSLHRSYEGALAGFEIQTARNQEVCAVARKNVDQTGKTIEQIVRACEKEYGFKIIGPEGYHGKNRGHETDHSGGAGQAAGSSG